ncbi:hypothetical protein [Actinoplanes siamensis]|uniref:Uncharacterized protein n=1 Tax=Actinoplanes siamensis TaxID=1223317 RepID=A0A919ND42_9ACTN|nr:hypothetical protein [Actinoplanes siamensis]GIF08718.1 hypothetical protein Asi03nite_62560 [Actinoplanes siamensis]
MTLDLFDSTDTGEHPIADPAVTARLDAREITTTRIVPPPCLPAAEAVSPRPPRKPYVGRHRAPASVPPLTPAPEPADQPEPTTEPAATRVILLPRLIERLHPNGGVR